MFWCLEVSIGDQKRQAWVFGWISRFIYFSSFFLASKTEGRKNGGITNACYHNKVLTRFPKEVKSWSLLMLFWRGSYFLQKILDLCATEGISILVHLSSQSLKLRRMMRSSEHLFFLWSWSGGCDLCRNLRMQTECLSVTARRFMDMFM